MLYRENAQKQLLVSKYSWIILQTLLSPSGKARPKGYKGQPSFTRLPGLRGKLVVVF
jgi:hypothetical protein